MASQPSTPEGNTYSTVAASPISESNTMNLSFSSDQLLLSWIISSLSEVVHSQVVGFDTSYKAWTTIKRIYANSNLHCKI
ncbi:hypothetical protein EJ110_NYTH26511 [Nymphaea thermarum]|nr:hypothetical protein EJ110_NYTH26511 [Nymphaea thermarum]